MPGRERPKRRQEGTRTFFHIPAETASGQPMPGFTP